jgi:tetratricopeptide (TPR) repeat protein
MPSISDLSKYCFFGFAFLFPLLFLFSNPLLVKVFFIIFAILIFKLQVIEAFKTKKFFIKKNLLIVFLFAAFMSLVFSKNISLSFVESIDSFFFLISLFLISVFSSNVLKRKEDINIFISYLCFGLVLASIVIVSSFVIKKYFVSIEPLVLLIGIGLGISLYNGFFKKRKSEIIISLIFSFVFVCALLVVGFKTSWFVASLFAFFVFWKKARENDFSLLKRKVLMSLIVFVTLFVVFLSPNIIPSSFVFNQPLSTQDSLNIVSKSVLSNVKNFAFGSGPGTFKYQYALYYDKALTSFTVDQGSAGFLTILSEFGVLGFVVFLCFLLSVLLKGIKSFLNNSSEADDLVFLIIFSLFVLMFVWRIELLLFALLFIFIGFSESFYGKEKTISFKASVILFVLFLLMSILFFKYAFAEQWRIEAFDQYKNDINGAILKMEKGSKTYESSEYYIDLSQLYLLRASDIFNNNWDLDDSVQKQKEENDKLVKEITSQAEVVAQRATVIDKYNFIAWQNLGVIYENTSFLVNDNSEKAINAFDKAIELSPNNFLAYVSKGRIYEERKDQTNALKAYKRAFEIYPAYEGLEEKILDK